MSWKVKVTNNADGRFFDEVFDTWSEATDRMIVLDERYTREQKSVNIALHTPADILLYSFNTIEHVSTSKTDEQS